MGSRIFWVRHFTRDLRLLTVPPKIIDEETTSDLIVRELSDVTLQCKVTGYPEPYVIWRRADGNDFFYGKEKGDNYFQKLYLTVDDVYGGKP